MSSIQADFIAELITEAGEVVYIPGVFNHTVEVSQAGIVYRIFKASHLMDHQFKKGDTMTVTDNGHEGIDKLQKLRRITK